MKTIITIDDACFYFKFTKTTSHKHAIGGLVHAIISVIKIEKPNSVLSTHNDECNKVDPIPERVRILNEIHDINPPGQTDHLVTTDSYK